MSLYEAIRKVELKIQAAVMPQRDDAALEKAKQEADALSDMAVRQGMTDTERRAMAAMLRMAECA